ncbi:MAG: M20 family peptidase [Blastocatellia bacterium]|nr:M20 family peptidase [Blastocatellia bacterium]
MVKTVLGISLGILLLLAVVIAVRTARFSSHQVPAERPTAVTGDMQAAASHLAQALTFPTISYDSKERISAEAFRNLHQFLETTYPRTHEVLTKETVNEYSLLYTWKGRDPQLKPILLMAHLDVVPVETGGAWHQPPFGGVIADGFIWGRGAWDDKSGVIGILEAVELLLQQGFQPRQTVYLAFGHDEEIGGLNGAAAIARLLAQRNVRLECVLDEGHLVSDGIMPGVKVPVAFIGVAEKGSLTLELRADSEGGHSSMPPRHTAIGILAAALARLDEHPMPGGLTNVTRSMFEVIGPEMPLTNKIVLANLWLFQPLLERQLAASPSTDAVLRTTTAPTMLEGSQKENVLPITAKAIVNFRIRPGDTIASVCAHVQKTVADDRIKIRTLDGTEPSPESPIDSRGFRQIERSIRQIFPTALVSPGLVVGATDSKHFAKISDGTYRFLPVVATAADLPRFHGTNERISVTNFGQVVRFYAQLLQNLDQ